MNAINDVIGDMHINWAVDRPSENTMVEIDAH